METLLLLGNTPTVTEEIGEEKIGSIGILHCLGYINFMSRKFCITFTTHTLLLCWADLYGRIWRDMGFV